MTPKYWIGLALTLSFLDVGKAVETGQAFGFPIADTIRSYDTMLSSGSHTFRNYLIFRTWPFNQIFRALPGYRGESQFGTWAHRIAVNRTLNALRKVKRLAKIETDIDEETGFIDGESDRTFLAESIEKAMVQLSPGARMVFVLHDIEGYTHDEIGKELGITSGGSKSQLFKARAKLRRLLAPLVDETVDAGRTHVAHI